MGSVYLPTCFTGQGPIPVNFATLEKNGYEGSGMTCPQRGQAAEFHSHRTHAPSSLVGPIRHSRAYYLCRRCGEGLFPFDREAGLTTRNLTPALERVATLAGTVADSFEKGAELLEEMAGVRLSEATVERTAEDAGHRLAEAVAAGRTLGPPADWPWHKDYEGKACAYVELDATGVRQQAPLVRSIVLGHAPCGAHA